MPCPGIRVNQAHSSGRKDGRVGWEKVPMGEQESSKSKKKTRRMLETWLSGAAYVQLL